MDKVEAKKTVSVWISLIRVKSGNTLLCMLLICICKYLKSVLRYKFLILNTYHQDTVCELGYEDLCLFFEAK